MSIWQSISDAVTGFGNSVLAALSRITGQPREADPAHSIAFTIGMIALGAKMAKADGVVTRDEVDAFKEVFHVRPEEMHNIARVFNLAKQEVAGYEAYARQVARLFAEQPDVLEDVMDGLFHIAKADGVVHDVELTYLESVAAIFGLEHRFRCIRARHIKAAEDDPYIVLGIEPCAEDDEVRQHYRKLVRDNHPDRHIAAGVPEEMIAIATEKLAAINSAYETVARERGL
ncbi:MAG: DnaJ family molecular chaperone [Rhizobiales bacterium]|nr:DnaJ family molecular chaperone [Hyphomicrobiales bacterium]